MWIYNKLNVKYASLKGKFFKPNLRVIVLRHFAQKLYNEDFHSSHTHCWIPKWIGIIQVAKLDFYYFFLQSDMNVWMQWKKSEIWIDNCYFIMNSWWYANYQFKDRNIGSFVTYSNLKKVLILNTSSSTWLTFNKLN